MANLSKDEEIALALTCALIEGKQGTPPNSQEVTEAYDAYQRMKKFISKTPESRADRGMSS